MKPEWQRKAKDPEIRAKWRQEALEQMESMRTSPTRANKLTEKMVSCPHELLNWNPFYHGAD